MSENKVKSIILKQDETVKQFVKYKTFVMAKREEEMSDEEFVRFLLGRLNKDSSNEIFMI